MEAAETNKKMKWKNNRSRIINALENNAHEDQLESMLINLSLLNEQEFLGVKNRLLFLALKNGSKECADLLLSKGSTYNSTDILIKCKYTKIPEVFNLLEEFDKKYELLKSDRNSIKTKKSYLIDRLIDTSKVDANNERVDFLLNLISDGFFTSEEVRIHIDSNYKDKPEKKSKFIALYREITLQKLGI